jgi:hypothetical protein
MRRIGRLHLWSLRGARGDTLFIAKPRDIVGLYLPSRSRASVPRVDEESRIQPLDRKQLGLPTTPAMPERRTRGYVRPGKTSLSAALDTPSDSVDKWHKRHRATEFSTSYRKLIRRCRPTWMSP